MKVLKGMGMWAATFLVAGAQADSVTHGGTTINMDFVDMGYAGNTADSTGYGSVGYNYRIGKFEVTANQWASVIAADSNVGNAGSRAGSQPTASSSWYESAKFANWLTTGNAYSGAYQFSGSGTLTNVNRATAVSTYGTVYVLPTEDEWYKAAYLKSDGSAYTSYATGDSVPGVETDANYGGFAGTYNAPWDVGTGTVENNGTFDMNGNIGEWNESVSPADVGRSWILGGSYKSRRAQNMRSFASGDRTSERSDVGFRVAAIPEPSSILLMGVVGGFAVFIRRYLML